MSTSIASLVDKALALRHEIEVLTDALEILEQQIRNAALTGPQIDLTDGDLEGKQYIARGTEKQVPVILTSDLIIQSFADKSTIHSHLFELAGDRLKVLYRPTITHKLVAKTGKHFRLEAAAQLGDGAPAFIAAAVNRDKYGIPRSQIKIAWDRATDNVQAQRRPAE